MLAMWHRIVTYTENSQMKKENVPQGDQQHEPAQQERNMPDTQKIMQRHLQDEHHQITDEELQNIQISTDHIDPEAYKTPVEEQKKDEDQDDTDLDDKVVTPWDLTT